MIRRLSGGLTVLAVPLVIVAVAVSLLVSEAFLAWEFGRSDFPSAPGFTDAERMALAVPSTLFLTDHSITPEALLVLTHAGVPLYTASEVSHLVDVRYLVGWVRRLGLAAGLFLAAAAAAARTAPRRRELTGHVGLGAAITLGLVVLVAAGAALAWPFLFVGFHVLFFSPGTWSFSEDSGLIRLFPEKFWFDTAVALLCLSGAQAGLLWLGARWAQRGRR